MFHHQTTHSSWTDLYRSWTDAFSVSPIFEPSICICSKTLGSEHILLFYSVGHAGTLPTERIQICRIAGLTYSWGGLREATAELGIVPAEKDTITFCLKRSQAAVSYWDLLSQPPKSVGKTINTLIKWTVPAPLPWAGTHKHRTSSVGSMSNITSEFESKKPWVSEFHSSYQASMKFFKTSLHFRLRRALHMHWATTETCLWCLCPFTFSWKVCWLKAK